ncbi:DNA resolvase [Acetobacter pasteurianus subsp. pasteurianus LMG 1262 = NBRC 106471]|nr:DNA resolvase [Acetobacter pasteurianus subsp. pasteurianus LMG 1262 = NBRC 106471]
MQFLLPWPLSFPGKKKNDGKHLFSVIYPQHPTLAYICARSMYRPLKARVSAHEPKARIARDLGISRETLYAYLKAA